jgi:hypothetical protein
MMPRFAEKPFSPSAERYNGLFVMSILCYAHKIDITFPGRVMSKTNEVPFISI